VCSSDLDHYNATVLDSSVEGILWVQLASKQGDVKWNICVVYLPPHGSSRNMDASAFFEDLHTQIFTYQNDGKFLIMGDFNSRIGDRPDFIEGIDNVPERDIIDTKQNAYSDLFCEFLISANCVVLNGTSNHSHDFTFVSTRGHSVVDYVIVPHDSLAVCKELEIIRAKSLFTLAGCEGYIDPDSANIPDHSLLKWKVVVHESYTPESEEQIRGEPFKLYDRKNIPDHFMQGDTLHQVMNVIRILETQLANQESIDEVYQQFTEVMKQEMNAKLKHKVVKPSTKSRSVNRRKHKAWWSDALQELWRTLCEAEKEWLRAPTTQKQQRKATMKAVQRTFQREVQRAKRQYWYKQQEDIMALCDLNQGEFWKRIGQVGIAQDRNKGVPMEVIDDDGAIIKDPAVVLNKWKVHFQDLLNTNVTDNANPDIEHLSYSEPVGGTAVLNMDISLQEIHNALKLAKTGKAVGIDELPVEVLKNELCANFLKSLFNVCFQTGQIPSVWGRSVITPVHKDRASEIREPGNHRGISITSSLYKLYCCVINDRLSKWVEENSFLADEQNGFRKHRNTVDHLLSLTNIIQTRKLKKQDTFVAYIDFSKAYDRINREFLWQKLGKLGINGHMMRALKSIYTNVSSCVKLATKTEWFAVKTGLRQGCLISPLLFNIYINDLAMTIKQNCTGIKIANNEELCLLMYADDIALLAENEKDLEKMLKVLNEWCMSWDVTVNMDKSQIVHFRQAKMPVTQFDFKVNDVLIKKVDKYKYLGLIFDYKMDYNVTAKAVAQSANRALGLLIAKSKCFGGLAYNCFVKLYESMVMPVITYGAAVWGNQQFSCIDAVHNRMCRYFLGVSKFTPNAAVQGDMGVRVPWQQQKLEIARQWCRLKNMAHDRVNKKIFQWADNMKCKNWNSKMKDFLKLCKLEHYWEEHVIDKDFFMNDIRECVEILHEEQWLSIICKEQSKTKKGKNKLRTYNTFKSSFSSESYVYNILPRSHRSALAQFRCGTAPIKLETGRYEGLPVESRICPICNNDVESELHVLIECPLYNEIRSQLFHKCVTNNKVMLCLSKNEQLKIILACQDDILVKECAKACNTILSMRRSHLYS
jgi:hypothetical protein